MKSARFFTIFIFLPVLAFQVCAQNEKPKIVWENLQETYKDFANVKPKIKNTFDKTLYLYPAFESDDIWFFESETDRWVNSKYILGCGNSPFLRLSKSIKLKPNQSLDLSEWLDWEFLLLGAFWRGSFKDKSKADWENIRYFKQDRKYKLVTFYSEQKNKDFKRNYSPEFWIKPIN
jgi:hypothetical protein